MSQKINKPKILCSSLIIFPLLSVFFSTSSIFILQKCPAAEETPHKKAVVIKVEAFRYGYLPDPIKVKKGDKVKLLITSRDVKHGFYIKEYGINSTVEKGKITEVNFLANKRGEFTIVCTVYCGSGHLSMKGKLVVE